MQHYRFLAETNCAEGTDEAFNDWYDNRHLIDVLEVPGIVAAQRFRLTSYQRDGAAPKYRYLAIYEIETDDLESVLKELTRRSGSSVMPLSDTLQAERQALAWEPITERVVERK